MPERAAPLLRVVTGDVERRGAEVEANLGNTRVFNAARGDAPPGVDVLGPTSGAATCPRSSVASSLSACPQVTPTSLKPRPSNRLDADADFFGTSCNSQMSSAPGSCSPKCCAAPRAQHLLRNVPGPSRRLPHTLAITMMRSGRQLKAFSATAEPGRPESFGSGASITGSILDGMGKCAPGDHTPTQQPG